MRTQPALHSRGASLIEMLIYIGLLAVVLGLGINALIRLWGSHGILRRQADGIVLAADVGERWRADVRAATGPIRDETDPVRQRVIIPVRDDAITWDFGHGVLWRQATQARKAAPLLWGIRSSHMSAEPRENVAAWRWELELEPATKRSRTIPRFTFFAVQGGVP